MPTSRYSFVHFLRSDLPLNHPYFLPKTGINWTITLPIKSFILFKISALNVYVINKFWKHSQIITVKLQHPIYVACNMQIEDHTIVGPPGGIGSWFPMKKSVIFRNPVKIFQFFRFLIFFLVILTSILFSTQSPL